jgi:predicted Rossmann fold flavoprotein
LQETYDIRTMKHRVVIIGGGAAGFFCAVNLARLSPHTEVILLEKANQLLGKVKISGGGRCNVTHACYEPKELIKYYPRGGREMLGPFHYFQPGDVFDWFEQRGIGLHTEDDNRVFPITNDSQTIIDCFMKEAQQYGVQIKTQSGVTDFEAQAEGYRLTIQGGHAMDCDAVVWTSGSSAQVWQMFRQKGYQIIDPVPSLFTFQIKDSRIQGLMGISAQHCSVRIEGTKFAADGPVLITHWGLSGPGILKLSAWAARELSDNNYDFIIRVNWDNRLAADTFMENLKDIRQDHAKSLVKSFCPARIPNRLWLQLLDLWPGIADTKWGELSNKQIEFIAESIQKSFFKVTGKSTNKDEFVTAGGIDLKQVDFKTMQSKLHPNVYFAGEILNIDAVTGGFNFQSAWTTAMITANHIAQTQLIKS